MPIPTAQDPIVRTTARERVYKTLQQWIVNGTLLPAERLNDSELAKHFSVSRTPVREALQMLAEQKLVTMVPSSGTFVAPIDDEDMAHVYELLGGLQAYAIDLAGSHLTQEALDQLTDINEQFYQKAKADNAAEAISMDGRFHRLIAELAQNPYLIAYTEQLMAQAHRNELRFFKANGLSRQSYDKHKRIIQALRDGDLEAAKCHIRQNWQISMQG